MSTVRFSICQVPSLLPLQIAHCYAWHRTYRNSSYPVPGLCYLEETKTVRQSKVTTSLEALRFYGLVLNVRYIIKHSSLVSSMSPFLSLNKRDRKSVV